MRLRKWGFDLGRTLHDNFLLQGVASVYCDQKAYPDPGNRQLHRSLLDDVDQVVLFLSPEPAQKAGSLN